MNEHPLVFYIQKYKVLLYIEYMIRGISYIQVVYIKCTRDLLATKREVSWVFDGQNANTKTPPEISEHDLFHAHNIHSSNYSNSKDSLVLP
jgi:hypothetical protein